jgi:hypothetical protein
MSERLKDQGSQQPRRDAIPGRMHGRDPVHVNGDFFVLLHNFKLRMVDYDLLPPLLWPSEDDQMLADRDHLLHVGHVEPATRQRLTEDASGIIFKGDLEHSPPPSDPFE